VRSAPGAFVAAGAFAAAGLRGAVALPLLRAGRRCLGRRPRGWRSITLPVTLPLPRWRRIVAPRRIGARLGARLRTRIPAPARLTVAALVTVPVPVGRRSLDLGTRGSRCAARRAGLRTPDARRIAAFLRRPCPGLGRLGPRRTPALVRLRAPDPRPLDRHGAAALRRRLGGDHADPAPARIGVRVARHAAVDDARPGPGLVAAVLGHHGADDAGRQVPAALDEWRHVRQLAGGAAIPACPARPGLIREHADGVARIVPGLGLERTGVGGDDAVVERPAAAAQLVDRHGMAPHVPVVAAAVPVAVAIPVAVAAEVVGADERPVGEPAPAAARPAVDPGAEVRIAVAVVAGVVPGGAPAHVARTPVPVDPGRG